MTINITEAQARRLLQEEVGRLVLNNAILNEEIEKIRTESVARETELSSILGQMHRELEKLDPAVAARFAVSPEMDARDIPAIHNRLSQNSGQKEEKEEKEEKEK